MPRSLTRAVGLANVVAGLEDLQDAVDGTAVYVVGTNVVYGVFLEFGTRKMQAYPWLRPAVEEFESNPERFLEAHAETSIDEVDSTDQLVHAIAVAFDNRFTDNVSAPGGDRSPGVHPEHPQRQSGNLAGSIRAVKIQG